jgi:hypothetical protein
MVSAEEKIQEHYLDRLGLVFGQNNHPEWQTPEAIRDHVNFTLQNSAKACDGIINYINSKL